MLSFAFFGSSRFSVIVLNELERLGLIPALIVTTPDKPVGRKLTITPNPVKVWAQAHKIEVIDPEKLNEDFIQVLRSIQTKKQIDKQSDTEPFPTENSSIIDVYVVASYGKIIPLEVLEIPPCHTLNIHPSLLPKYRGASPLQSAILDDSKDTGVTIMRIDEKMDHGPIVVQENVQIENWPTYEEFEELMAKKGAQLLARILPNWISNIKNGVKKLSVCESSEKNQDHSLATYTTKIKKEDAQLEFDAKTLSLVGDPYKNFLKIQAYHEWPQAFFFFENYNNNEKNNNQANDDKKIRVKITKASYDLKSSQLDNVSPLKIEKVIPEGGKGMNYQDFLRGYQK